MRHERIVGTVLLFRHHSRRSNLEPCWAFLVHVLNLAGTGSRILRESTGRPSERFRNGENPSTAHTFPVFCSPRKCIMHAPAVGSTIQSISHLIVSKRFSSHALARRPEVLSKLLAWRLLREVLASRNGSPLSCQRFRADRRCP